MSAAVVERPDGLSEHALALRSTIPVWCPTYPRRATKHQEWVLDEDVLFSALADETGSGPGYVSVYAFPEGHPRDGGIPEIDTVFFDFDIPGDSLYGRPKTPEDVNELMWSAEMNRLLSMIGDVAAEILDTGMAPYFRASLSGHKGVHLFIDFEPIDLAFGPTAYQVQRGLAEYVEGLVDVFREAAGSAVDEFLDVDSTDIARLTRVPNTVHDTATMLYEEPRFCVPVSIEELVDIDADTYRRLTAAPRLPPHPERRPSEKAADVLTRYIWMAPGGPSQSSTGPGIRGTRTQALSHYRENVADSSITLEDGYMTVKDHLLQRKPCMWWFRDRDDCWDHGNQSHYFKIAIINELTLMGAPLEVIHEFFSGTPNYDERLTESEIGAVLSMNYHRPTGMKKLRQHSPIFAGTNQPSR
ncbi:DNA primase [Halorubrum tailed virus 27]|uniref:DNA primase n=1 Tax=Halorubrum tailed virus 27 TaxID=2878008 RepID=A0AAE8XXZ2_9CAUD|nr:DNA primase [Halorubrum tailed virus 27]UBF22755.1 DNA primase [Halorubrum tailed virus 27]